MTTKDRLQELDCRGLLCPQPVIQTKEALDSLDQGQLRVLVDNEAAVSNVARFARSRGLAVEIQHQDGGLWSLLLRQVAASPESSSASQGKTASADEPTTTTTKPRQPQVSRIIVIVAADTMGQGDQELGRVLLRAFIKTLPSLDLLPEAIYFYNSGVKITALAGGGVKPDEGLLEPLRDLTRRGVAIYSCGTCLDFFGLKEGLLVGEVTNMYEIIKAMATATSLIRP